MDHAVIQATYQREVLSGLWDELLPLFRLHYREISAHQDILLEPDVAGYKRAEDAGCLRLYVARVEGKPVGYSMFFVRENMHYASSKQAVQDIIYLLPEFRGTGMGIDLVNFSDDELRAEGVQLVHHHVKIAHPALGNMLQKRCGYTAVETIYSKRLDK